MKNYVIAKGSLLERYFKGYTSNGDEIWTSKIEKAMLFDMKLTDNLLSRSSEFPNTLAIDLEERIIEVEVNTIKTVTIVE